MNQAEKLVAQFKAEHESLKAQEGLAEYIVAYIAEEIDRGTPKQDGSYEYLIIDAIQAYMGGAR